MEAKGKKRPDRRHARTERRIREAFTELVMEKNVDKITIKELAERADIDRKTFYLHYSSVWDVLEEIQVEILEQVDGLMSEFDLFHPSFDALGFLRGLNGLIEENSDFYRRMLVADRYSFFYVKLKEAMKAGLRKKYREAALKATVSPVKLELYAEYATSGLMAVYVDWLKHPEYDLKEVAETANEIAYGGIRKVLQGLMAGT